MPLPRDLEPAALDAVSRAILDRIASNRTTPEAFFGEVLRRSIDEVIDGPRTGRWSVTQLSKTEKTYVGTKVEIVTRAALEMEESTKLDVEIDGHQVDIKWSMRGTWMIAPENVGEICLGLGSDIGQRHFHIGLFVPYVDRMGNGKNRDGKGWLAANARRRHVRWLVPDAPLRQNFVAALDDELRQRVFAERSAEARIRMLVTCLPGVFIPREAFTTVALNKGDPLRRLRCDRAKGETLGGMRLLSTRYNKTILARLGYTSFPKEHWIAIPIEHLVAAGVE